MDLLYLVKNKSQNITKTTRSNFNTETSIFQKNYPLNNTKKSKQVLENIFKNFKNQNVLNNCNIEEKKG